MALAAWWGRDPLPSLSSLASFSADPTSDEPTLAHLNGLSLAEIRSRLQAGHRPIWPILDYLRPGKPSSGTGIHKARFTSIGQLSFQGNGQAGLVPLSQREQATIAA